jgi:hypothetical protein
MFLTNGRPFGCSAHSLVLDKHKLAVEAHNYDHLFVRRDTGGRFPVSAMTAFFNLRCRSIA